MKVVCQKHNVEYENRLMLSGLGEIEVRCPKCVEEYRRQDYERQVQEQKEKYIQEVKHRLDVCGLPKLVLDTKIDYSLIYPQLKQYEFKTNLFLYGNPGSGKTMTLKYLVCKSYKKTSMYIDSVLIKTYSKLTLEKLYESLRNMEIVFIDEIQVLPMEIFEVIVELIYNAGGLFVLCGNLDETSAKAFINGLSNRISSRLLRNGMNYFEFDRHDLRTTN